MTLCAWCGEPVVLPKKYNGELICLKCYERREEAGMESWEKALDRWLTTPPEEKESSCKCCVCKEMLFPDDEYYRLDGEIHCSDCAETWLEGQKEYVTEDMAYGE